MYKKKIQPANSIVLKNSKAKEKPHFAVFPTSRCGHGRVPTHYERGRLD